MFSCFVVGALIILLLLFFVPGTMRDTKKHRATATGREREREREKEKERERESDRDRGRREKEIDGGVLKVLLAGKQTVGHVAPKSQHEQTETTAET